MQRHRSLVLGLVVGVTLVTTPTVAQQTQEPQSWIHVHIAGTGDAEGDVAVNLPLSAVQALVAMVPDDVVTADGQLTLTERGGLTVSEVRQIWQEVRDAGDAEFLTFQEGDQTVRVARAGDRIQVRIEDDDETGLIDLPLAVVDALLSGDGETLNIAAAFDELSTIRGDIVRVTDGDRQIRVWVDERSEQ